MNNTTNELTRSELTRAMEIEHDIKYAANKARFMAEDIDVTDPRIYGVREDTFKLKGITNAVKTLNNTTGWTTADFNREIFAASMVAKIKESKFKELHDVRTVIELIRSFEEIANNDEINLISKYWDKIGTGCTILSQHEEPTV